MIDLMRGWLVGITCAAMIVALAESLAPTGTVRKIGKLTGGLVLLLAMLQPLVGLEQINITGQMAGDKADGQSYSTQLEQENQDLVKRIIADEAGAYIVDKAAELGMVCTAEVLLEGEADAPVPQSVIIRGDGTQAQRTALSKTIADELAIPAARQCFEGEDRG